MSRTAPLSSASVPKGRSAALKRRQTAATQAAVRASAQNIPKSQILRVRKLKPVTRDIYVREANLFIKDYNLNPHVAPPNLNTILNDDLVDAFLSGSAPSRSRTRYYAVRWYYAVPNASLQLAYESMLGHIANLGARVEPEAWDAVVLQALALLSAPHTKFCPKTRALAVCAFLVAFDLYCRAMDVLFILREECRPPTGRNIKTSKMWTITLWPSTGTASSKTYVQDQTLVVGMNPERAWVRELCPLLKYRPDAQERLFPLTERT